MDPVDRFAAIVNGHEVDVRLDEAAFCISAAVRPGVDVDERCRHLDELASTANATSFDEVRRFLFAVNGFRGDTDDYGDPSNSFLDAVIDRRRGIPITLAVLLIEVARRQGIGVAGIGMPGHFLTRELSVADRWCDSFHGGAMLERADCARLFRAIHGDARPLSDQDLAPTPPRAILARMLTNLEYGRFGEDPRRLAVVSAMHLAIPRVPLAQQVNLLRAVARGGDPVAATRAYERAVATAPEGVAAELQAEAQRIRSRWN
jgi:regulator of sirC expression with transglutaminase-like and TPR domain